MQNFLEQKNCSIHNQICVAVDITQQVDTDNRQLCIKCLTEQLSLNKSVLLNNEVITILNEIKFKQFERKKSLIEQSLEKYQTSIIKIQDFMEFYNGCLNKILIQFNSQIEALESQLNQLKEPQVEDTIKLDFPVLYQNFSELNSFNLKQISENNQKELKEFFTQIQKQLECLKQENKMQQIFDYFNEVINKKEPEEELILQKIENQTDSKRTPSLQHKCSKHGKEIIVFTFDESCQGERILCVDCIPKFQHDIITLEDANKLWLTYQGEQYDSENKFQCERQQKYCENQKIMQRFQKNYQQLQDEILQLIQIQNNEIEHQIQDLQKNNTKQSLMQLELKDLKATIKQISQKDKFYQLKQQQMKLNYIDQNNLKEIVRKLCEIELLQKDCQQELFKLFNYQDPFIQDFQIQLIQFQYELQNEQLDSTIFTNLMPKFQNGLLQSLLVLMKGLKDKGNQYIEQLNDADSQIKNQELEQKNIQNYLNALTQFDRQYQIIEDMISLQDDQTQTRFNLEVDLKIFNINQQIGQQKQLTINTINTLQIKCINKCGFKNQLIQTNNSLLIDSQIIQVPQRIQKVNLSVNQIREHRFYYFNFYQFGKLLKFSSNLKHSRIIISADGKTAKSITSDWQLCLCDQPIPKYCTVVVDFKVKQSQHNYIMAGVCLIDSINKDDIDSFGIGQGCYLLYSPNGQILSHHDKEKDSKFLGFTFNQNDIISMEVNVQEKQITWKNKAKNQVYTLEIQTTSDLYFCFNLIYQNKIELL